MPDFFGVYDDMKVIEYLEFFAAAYRIKGPARRKICDEVLELVDLGYKRDAFVTSLSRGMTQRLGLARVLLHDPQVLLLDEPASGLDPRARIEIRGLLKELREHGQDDHGLQPHPARAGRHLQQDRHHRAGRTARERRRGRRDEAGPPADGAARSAWRATWKRPPTCSASSTTWSRASNRVPSDIYRHAGAEGAKTTATCPPLLVAGGHKLTLFKEDEINLETAFMALTKGITS